MSDIGPFYVGDIPASPITLFVDSDGQDADLSAYTGVDVKLYAPGNVLVEDAFTGAIEEDTVVLTWGEDSPFTEPGIYSLQVALTAPNVWQTLPPEFVVAQLPSTQWHNLDSARAEWPTKGSYSDVQLWTLLECARVSVETYAPVLAEDAPFPVGWRQAQLMQARNLANAGKTDPSNSVDGDLFVIRPYPLDNIVRQLIRPKRGVPVVG